jgi:hypothetical protein
MHCQGFKQDVNVRNTNTTAQRLKNLPSSLPAERVWLYRLLGESGAADRTRTYYPIITNFEVQLLDVTGPNVHM